MSPAFVVAITEENLRRVIRSEAGPSFDLDIAMAWLEEHQEGWFLRDEGSPFDCQFFMPEVLKELYSFTNNDQNSLFRHVIRN